MPNDDALPLQLLYTALDNVQLRLQRDAAVNSSK